ncbi:MULTISPECIES: PepSY domain-containing protein [unclassified Neptuniibacter]|uniref:PepSY domain-containing protein n=1 Tax=unclassified Neptuniibacter TaxID=2630693 RepID=UPI000C4722E2|nr:MULTISPECIES: PepSY domain-containing protein [unclassified Neptuniibacter]MAY42497.1 peptidase [Oceanospirillaceae bacterium]|tara:strand:+ start:6975 stop:7289 length:315 start_codon:yes stop_codon:yes gene_type:complete
MMIFFRASTVLLLCFYLCLAESRAENLSSDYALSQVDAGKVLPLSEIIRLHPLLSESRLLDIELVREDDGVLIYEFEILQSENIVLELEIDAATGQLLREGFEE